MRPISLLPLAALLLTGQAPPPDKPPAQPVRDVTVEYTLKLASGPEEAARDRPLKVYWAKGGARMRIEMGDERSYVVLNRDAARMMMVLLDEHAYVETPYDPKRPTGFTAPQDVPLMRGRTEFVAGNPCTMWHARRGEGSGSLCVTDDGVVLRAIGFTANKQGDVVANLVTYGPQPASVFDPPPGFRNLDLAARPAVPDQRKP